MFKIRTFKQFTMFYELRKDNDGFIISIVKDSLSGTESSTFAVSGNENELAALLCRMWGCNAMPTSLRYILEDEGFLPKEVEETWELKEFKPRITKRPPSKGLVIRELAAPFDSKK